MRSWKERKKEKKNEREEEEKKKLKKKLKKKYVENWKVEKNEWEIVKIFVFKGRVG